MRRIIQQVDRERVLPGGRELHLSFRLADDHPIPAVLLLPEASSPVPGALLVHGYSSRKEDMSPVGRALLARGIASLALDLPMHGTRADPVQSQAARNPLAMMQLWKQALADVRLGMRYLAARAEIDARKLAIAGYSMGSFLAVLAAAEDASVRAVVVAAGGDLPENTPFGGMARLMADPLRAVKKLKGRPLLMVHGRRDRTVTPAQAQRLYDAAGEPKELVWWDAGHYLPQEASTAAAEWLARQLRQDRS